MNVTTPAAWFLIRAPRSTVTHVSRHGEQTLCRREVRDTWGTELLELAGAKDAATCTACRAGAEIALMHQRQVRPSDTYAENLPAQPATVQLEELPVDRTPLTLLVVPCSGAKLDQPAPARELYRGTLTTMGLAACAVVEGSAEQQSGHVGTRTMILSALHGLLELDTIVEPYDVRMGASDSISTQQLADQLRATGATRLVALTPNAYTNALRAACELAGVQLVAALEGCRGIGEQRGRLAQLRRSGGYGAGLGLETRRTAQLHADALAEDRARTAAAAQDAQRLVHLLSNDLLDACGTSVAGRDGYHHFTPVHADVTCPRCLELIPELMDQAHAEALAEDAAHDAAMEKAEPLTPELLERCADQARQEELHDHYARRAIALGHAPGCALVTTERNWPTIMRGPACSCGIAAPPSARRAPQLPRAMRYGARLQLVSPR